LISFAVVELVKRRSFPIDKSAHCARAAQGTIKKGVWVSKNEDFFDQNLYEKIFD
jgi:hypothetical protein